MIEEKTPASESVATEETSPKTKPKRKVDVKTLGSLALAYMGDALYDVRIREHLLEIGKVKPNQLHQAATKYVSAKAQCATVHYFYNNEILTEDEIIILKRGRNAKSGSVPKNTDVITYNTATGFEALLGHLYFDGQKERLSELIELAIGSVEQNLEKK